MDQGDERRSLRSEVIFWTEVGRVGLEQAALLDASSLNQYLTLHEMH
jgi:hypothetical protein